MCAQCKRKAGGMNAASGTVDNVWRFLEGCVPIWSLFLGFCSKKWAYESQRKIATSEHFMGYDGMPLGGQQELCVYCVERNSPKEQRGHHIRSDDLGMNVAWWKRVHLSWAWCWVQSQGHNRRWQRRKGRRLCLLFDRLNLPLHWRPFPLRGRTLRNSMLATS